MAAAAAGYVVIRGVIPPNLAKEAAALIPGNLKVRMNGGYYTEYEPSPLGLQISQLFDEKGDKSGLRQLLGRSSGEKLRLTSVGIFQKTNAIPRTKKGRAKTVYVTIALTDLNPGNGLPTFLVGSHRVDTVPSGWTKERLDLRAGDAMVWCGEMEFGVSDSEGGGVYVVSAYVLEGTD